MTLRHDAEADTHARIDLLLAQAARPVCDLVAHGNFHGEAIGYLYDRQAQRFASSAGESDLTDAALRSRAADAAQALTYTARHLARGEEWPLAAAARSGAGLTRFEARALRRS